jgi:sugar O-acyltransferase (sialic acid O-acetyltransferase NeuD family)
MEVKNIGIVGCGQWEILRSIRIYNRMNSGKIHLETTGFFDDDPAKIGKEFSGYRVLGNIESLADSQYKDLSVINNIRKDCEIRKKVAERLHSIGARFFSFAILRDTDLQKDQVVLGEGVEIHEYTYIGHNTSIGNHTAIAYNVTIGHENSVGEYCFVAPGAVLAGRVSIGQGVYIGAGAVIIQNIKIGDWSTVGAGSVVMADVPPYCTVIGNPARVVYKKDKGA